MYIIFKDLIIIKKCSILKKYSLTCRPKTKVAAGARDVDVQLGMLSDAQGLEEEYSWNRKGQARRALQLKSLLAGTKV